MTKLWTLACLNRYFLKVLQKFSEFVWHYYGLKLLPMWKQSKSSVPSILEPSLSKSAKIRSDLTKILQLSLVLIYSYSPYLCNKWIGLNKRDKGSEEFLFIAWKQRVGRIFSWKSFIREARVEKLQYHDANWYDFKYVSTYTTSLFSKYMT